MPVVEERFNQEKINSLKRYLEKEATKNRTREYEIIIDGFKVVPRTDDVTEFEDYEDEMRENTKNISFIIYELNSNRNTRYSFNLNPENPISSQPVNGLGSLGEIDQLIQQRLDEKDKDYQINALKERVKSLEDELDEAEEYHDILKNDIEKLKESKYDFNGFNLIEIGGEILKHTLVANANKSPLTNQLAGILGAISNQSNAHQNHQPPQEGEVSFSEPTSQNNQFTDHQLQLLEYIQKMEAVLDNRSQLTMNKIISKLLENPSLVLTVADLLNIKNQH